MRQMANIQDLSSLKMYRDFFPHTKEKTLELSLKRFQKSKTKPFCSKPKKWEKAGLIVGEGLSISWRILDAQYWLGVPQRESLHCRRFWRNVCRKRLYFEQESPCQGILESKRKGKNAAPQVLKDALRGQAQ